MKRGIFITIEGIDGCGKTTQSKALFSLLKRKGIKVILTKEPTKSPLGKFARLLAQNTSNEFLQSIFAADRKEHSKKVIAPALKKGFVVISDRYIHSAYAYSKENKKLKSLSDDIVMPVKTFILDIPVKLALERMKVRKSKSAFENEKELSRVRKKYLAMGGSCDIIDGKLSKKEITKILYDKISLLL